MTFEQRGIAETKQTLGLLLAFGLHETQAHPGRKNNCDNCAHG